MRYTKQTVLGFAGGLLLASPFLIDLPGQIGAYIKQSQLKAEAEIAKAETAQGEEIERARIKQKRQTLDLASKAGEHTRYLNLMLPNYTDSNINPNPPTDRYKETDDVHVTDKNGACVGRIRNGKWEWKRWYENACSD